MERRGESSQDGLDRPRPPAQRVAGFAVPRVVPDIPGLSPEAFRLAGLSPRKPVDDAPADRPSDVDRARRTYASPSDVDRPYRDGPLASDVDRAHRTDASPSDVDRPRKGVPTGDHDVEGRRAVASRAGDVALPSDVDRSASHARFPPSSASTAERVATIRVDEFEKPSPRTVVPADVARQDVTVSDPSYEPEGQVPFPVFRLDIGGKGSGELVETAIQREKAALVARAVASRKVEPRSEEMGTRNHDRSEDTKLQYRRRGAALKRRFMRENRITDVEMIDLMAFAYWFVSLRAGWKPSTWRHSKQSALLALETFQSADVEDAIAVIERDGAHDSGMDGAAKPAAEAPSRKIVTNESKARYVDYADLVQLDAHLHTRGWSEFSSILSHWMWAGCATGLRPFEWKNSVLLEYPEKAEGRLVPTFLLVMNAKATNGRSNGHVRTLDITRLPNDRLVSIREIARLAKEWDEAGTFSTNMHLCSTLLYRTCHKLWPRRRRAIYALYSCRHQFIQNLRQLGRSEVEIAALVGHNVTKSQNVHYGQRSKGWSPEHVGSTPVPSSQEVSLVRRVDDYQKKREKMLKVAAGMGEKAPEATVG